MGNVTHLPRSKALRVTTRPERLPFRDPVKIAVLRPYPTRRDGQPAKRCWEVTLPDGYRVFFERVTTALRYVNLANRHHLNAINAGVKP